MGENKLVSDQGKRVVTTKGRYYIHVKTWPYSTRVPAHMLWLTISRPGFHLRLSSILGIRWNKAGQD
jgi:hypothetical protein